jgi:hypothetical protein
MIADRQDELAGFTAAELIAEARRRARERAEIHGTKAEHGREFSLAATALEEALVRWTKGLARVSGIFNEIDLETPAGEARAQANWASDNPTGAVP